MADTEQVRIPPTVYERAQELVEEKKFATMGEAIRHMCQEGGYDV